MASSRMTHTRRLAAGLALVLGAAWLFPAHGLLAFRSLAPRTLLVYYAYASGINGTFSVPGAAAAFGQYNYVVLGDGLEQVTHPDHANTVSILANPQMAGTTVFGYIDLGVTTQDLPDAEI